MISVEDYCLCNWPREVSTSSGTGGVILIPPPATRWHPPVKRISPPPVLSSARPQSTTMVGRYLLWLSRSQRTLVLRHLDLEYGSFVGGVSPPSSHAADPGDWGGGGWECECISMFNVRWFCRSPVSTQYSAQCSVVPDDPDGVGTSAADDPWLKAPTASKFHVYLPYRGLKPV